MLAKRRGVIFNYNSITQINFRGACGGRAVYAFGTMRIAKPILLVSTPVGVAFGLLEAWRVGAWLGTLMLALIGVLSGFLWLTVRRIRTERDGEARDDR